MDHYIDIKLKPDAEMRENVLLNMVYAKLHKTLFDLNNTSVGVSFPDYQLKLGSRIRLHGSSADLEKLQSKNWLGGLIGYCAVTNITKIPAQTQHRIISRIQSNMTQAKLNRLLKHGSIQSEQVREYKAKLFTKGLDNPYVELQSVSNGHKHRRYIQFGELKSESISGGFDFFGLSKFATIPWF
jgi:CRISPR-associated endonuclease Csy4